MIYLIIKSYLTLLVAVSGGSLLILIVGSYLILRKPTISTSSDFDAIAGDDVMATQLDLARAYVEADKSSLAVPILESIISQGSNEERQEAKRLLSTCHP